MRLFFGGLLICMLMSARPSVGQEPSRATVPNGCGTGWSLYLVPDSLPISRCRFKEACDVHDICYGKCEKSFEGKCEYLRCREGGDLYKHNKCKTDERLLHVQVEAGQRKIRCDNDFYSKMRALNKARAVCEAFAIVYRDAVKQWGGASFAGASQFEGPVQPKEKYEGAIREFFVKGSEEQFKKIVQAEDAGENAVNLRRPIAFDPSQGLVNIKQ